MKTYRTGTALLTLTVAAVLASCAADTGAPPAEPDPSDAAPSEPAPTPTSPPEDEIDLADPASWVIEGDGIGPILMGGDFAATLDELPEPWASDDYCTWTASWRAEDGAYQMYFVQDTSVDDGPITVATVSAMLDAIPEGEGPQTADGLGLGASKDEVRTQHPEAEEGTSTIGDSTWLAVSGDTDARIFFEYAADADQAYSITVTTAAEPPYEVCG